MYRLSCQGDQKGPIIKNSPFPIQKARAGMSGREGRCAKQQKQPCLYGGSRQFTVATTLLDNNDHEFAAHQLLLCSFNHQLLSNTKSFHIKISSHFHLRVPEKCCQKWRSSLFYSHWPSITKLSPECLRSKSKPSLWLSSSFPDFGRPFWHRWGHHSQWFVAQSDMQCALVHGQSDHQSPSRLAWMVGPSAAQWDTVHRELRRETGQ